MAGGWALLGEDMKKAVDEFADSKSARIVAILGASLVDEMLRRTLAYRFIESSLVDEAFKPAGGFLGTMHAKTQLGYLIGMYGKPERRALVSIYEIRNKFAHRLTVHLFDDPALDDNFKGLILHTTYKMFPDPFAAGDSDVEVPSPKDKHECFMTNLQLLTVILMRDYQSHFSHSFYPKPIGRLPHGFPIPPSHKPSPDRSD